MAERVSSLCLFELHALGSKSWLFPALGQRGSQAQKEDREWAEAWEEGREGVGEIARGREFPVTA